MKTLGNFEDFDLPDDLKLATKMAVDSYISQLNESSQLTKYKVKALYDIIDEVNEDSFKGKQQPSCSKGCAHCCYIQVSTTEWEADLILDYMKHYNLEFEPKDIERLKKQAVCKDDSDYILSPDRKCVFLQDDNSCGIYEVRPSTCRNYYVFNDPSECDTFNDKASGRTLVNFNLDSVIPIMALMQTSKHDTMPRLLLEKIKP